MKPISEELKGILRKFNLMGYADKSVKYENNVKNRKVLVRIGGHWMYEDKLYGGESYSGNETLWFDNKDVFRSVYWGKVVGRINLSDTYAFLGKTLKKESTGK